MACSTRAGSADWFVLLGAEAFRHEQHRRHGLNRHFASDEVASDEVACGGATRSTITFSHLNGGLFTRVVAKQSIAAKELTLGQPFYEFVL